MENTALQVADRERTALNGALSDTQSRLGQFMTPSSVARLMASLVQCRTPCVRILDPGAGVGALTAAAVDRLVSRKNAPRAVMVTCFEIDSRLCARLETTLSSCRTRCEERGVRFVAKVYQQDFIKSCAKHRISLADDDTGRFDLVIMNPPYRKINSGSAERTYLRAVGIETSNLYSAFMLLGARLVAEGGEFVSINPRSFCNGPYFRPFRLELLDLLDLRQLHVFESRSEAFKEDAVLQENIIVYGKRARRQSASVKISTTLKDGSVVRRAVAANHVWSREDSEAIIHLCSEDRVDLTVRQIGALPSRLAGLGVTASTGRVVDFRARDHLRDQPSKGAAPLIYPLHLRQGQVAWPAVSRRKPNAIDVNEQTQRLMVPRGNYVLVRRFSAKEERRRVVAALYDPGRIDADVVGFENKLNYLHCGGAGLDPELARGLVVYLNSTPLDDYFRTFSGHTQVNAADLRRLPFPATEDLQRLGRTSSLHEQSMVDAAVEKVLHRSV